MGYFLDTFALLYFLLIFVMRSTFKRYKGVNSLFLQLIFPQIARALDINRKCRILGKDFLGGISKVYTKVHLGLSNTTFEYNEYVQRYIFLLISRHLYLYMYVFLYLYSSCNFANIRLKWITSMLLKAAD